MFATACACMYAARSLHGRIELANDIRGVTSALFTNLAFSVELLLKCILEINALPRSRQHRLLDLYHLLPKPEQEILSHRFTQAIESSWFYQNIKGAGIPVIDDIEIALNEANNAFVRFRYSYEFDRPNTPGLTEIVRVLIARVIEIRPDFEDLSKL
tara:strand:- start:1364 stop:1834 length:471 start_codon:yes stop_codon:yes gene_type:complete